MCGTGLESKKKRFEWDIDKVRYFVEVESGSGCKLISNEYENNRSNLFIRCKCGEHFNTNFNKFKDRLKRRCNACSNIKKSNSMKLSYEEVKAFINVQSSSGCTLIDNSYVGNNVKINVRCKCGNPFTVTYTAFKSSSKRKCNICSHNQRAEKNTKNNSVFIKELSNKFGNKYTCLSNYKKSKEKIKIKNNICKHIYYIAPSDLLNGTGCSKCSGKEIKSTDIFRDEVYNLTGHEYSVIGEYVNSKRDIALKHGVCGCIFKQTPNNFLRALDVQDATKAKVRKQSPII